MEPLKISNREQQVLTLIADELSTEEIAKNLHLSFETVRSHRKNLLRKLDVKNTAGLIREGFYRGILFVPRRAAMIMCMILYVYSVSAQQIWYVQVGMGGTGTSWADATGELQRAIDSCDVGDTIWVALGNYFPTQNLKASMDPRDKTFYINKNIAVYGGFNGTETAFKERDPQAHKTFLSGDIGVPNDTSDNCYHVVYIDAGEASITPACILDGFEITKGIASGDPGSDSGGGLFNLSAGNECSPTISNCIFSENFADLGGACYNHGIAGISNPTFCRCVFNDNVATRDGGAMYNAGTIGGQASPIISHCEFYNNQAPDGAAIFNNGVSSGESNPQIMNSLFFDNHASAIGGALYNSFLSVSNVINCTFYGNTAFFKGSAIYTRSTDSHCYVSNSIIWNHSNPFGFDSGAGATMTFCVFDDGFINGNVSLPSSVTGSNNLDADPLFVDISNDNFRLQASSPGLSQANPDSLPIHIQLDLDRQPRYTNLLDVGSYEYPYGGCVSTQLPSIIDDLYGPIDGSYFSNVGLILGRNAVINSGAAVSLRAPNVDIEINTNISHGASFTISIGDCP